MQKTTLQALSACREYSRDCRHDLWKGTQVLHEASDSCSNRKHECVQQQQQQQQQLHACITILLTCTDVYTDANCKFESCNENDTFDQCEPSRLASASSPRYSPVIADSYLLLNTDCWKSYCRPEDLCLQILTLPLQVGGSPKQVLHDIRWRGAGGLLPLVRGDASCMLQQIHLLMQHTHLTSVCHNKSRCPLKG